MGIHVLLLNTKGVSVIEGFRLEVCLREFTRHCVILVLFRVSLCSLKGRWYKRLTNEREHSVHRSPRLSSRRMASRIGVWCMVNVWCGVLGNKLIGHFVFDNNLTGNTYVAFLRNELPGLLEDIPLTIKSQMYFQHDGAPPHYTRQVRDYLNEPFPNRWLGRGGAIMYCAWNPNDNNDMSASVSVVQFNGFM